jgi:hypothetical protein
VGLGDDCRGPEARRDGFALLALGAQPFTQPFVLDLCALVHDLAVRFGSQSGRINHPAITAVFSAWFARLAGEHQDPSTLRLDVRGGWVRPGTVHTAQREAAGVEPPSHGLA